MESQNAKVTGEETRKASHTPAPWRVDPQPQFLKTAHYIRGSKDDGSLMTWGLGVVAIIPRSTRNPSDANAHLIAAAPDLLAACKEVLSHPSVSLCKCGKRNCATTRLRKAIRKAEGR